MLRDVVNLKLKLNKNISFCEGLNKEIERIDQFTLNLLSRIIELETDDNNIRVPLRNQYNLS